MSSFISVRTTTSYPHMPHPTPKAFSPKNTEKYVMSPLLLGDGGERGFRGLAIDILLSVQLCKSKV